jgi:hypothetical protein
MHHCKTIQDDAKLKHHKTHIQSLEGKIITACCLISIHKLGLIHRRLLNETLADGNEGFENQKAIEYEEIPTLEI